MGLRSRVSYLGFTQIHWWYRHSRVLCTQIYSTSIYLDDPWCGIFVTFSFKLTTSWFYPEHRFVRKIWCHQWNHWNTLSRSLARSQLIQWSVPMLYAKQAACCLQPVCFCGHQRWVGEICLKKGGNIWTKGILPKQNSAKYRSSGIRTAHGGSKKTKSVNHEILHLIRTAISAINYQHSFVWVYIVDYTGWFFGFLCVNRCGAVKHFLPRGRVSRPCPNLLRWSNEVSSWEVLLQKDYFIWLKQWVRLCCFFGLT